MRYLYYYCYTYWFCYGPNVPFNLEASFALLKSRGFLLFLILKCPYLGFGNYEDGVPSCFREPKLSIPIRPIHSIASM